jgi:hypothetical protein
MMALAGTVVAARPAQVPTSLELHQLSKELSSGRIGNYGNKINFKPNYRLMGGLKHWLCLL